MVSTTSSVAYTREALKSFFACTQLTQDDTFLLMVNDPQACPDFGGIAFGDATMSILRHAAPKSFAANVNIALALAYDRHCGLIFLNNDIIFTPNWLPPLLVRDDAISLPVCNQQYCYQYDGLDLQYYMDLGDFAGRQAALDAIAVRHTAAMAAEPYRREALMPFFCFHVPAVVLRRIGWFDDSFGAGGGEDVDYRLRAMQAGFDCVYAQTSYLLHFMGRSTWRGAESQAETDQRNTAYRERLRTKWGKDTAKIFLSGFDSAAHAEQLGVSAQFHAGDFKSVLSTCLARRGAFAEGCASRSTICLSMIVKNESEVIRRCLDSVRPLIDYWVIVDTGSTDGTQKLIHDIMASIPGELYERPWVDFAHNRNEALSLARPKADYSLIIDADDFVELSIDCAIGRLDKDSYLVAISDTGIAYQRVQLVSNKLPWQYRGVLHEFLTCEGAKSQDRLAGMLMRRNHDGARRRDPNTYSRDATVLEAALTTETDDSMRARYTFYLAQSYRDCGQEEKALENYLKRADLGHWDQERYIALTAAAQLQQSLNFPPDTVLATWRRAIESCPLRAEAYHGASRYLRGQNRFAEGYEIAKPGLDLVPPADGLFVSTWIYSYGLLDEFAVNAYWAGHYQESLDACNRIVALHDLSDDTRRRIEANAAFAVANLAEAGTDQHPVASYPVSTWQPDRPLGGTELMHDGLVARLGTQLEAIDLRLNGLGNAPPTGRPLVVWIHHDIDQVPVKWCADADLVAQVDLFVFVSYWQRERYLREFNILPERAVVLRNAIPITQELRAWPNPARRRVAYTSTPYRGLAVLLDAWDRLRPQNAELHVWSSRKLYGLDEHDEGQLLERAKRMDGVHYRGIVPNETLRTELAEVDILAYPSTFAETSCLSVIEAMAAGCRVICPSLGALPETTAGFARIYPSQLDPARHGETFAAILADELATPWSGDVHLAWEEQVYARAIYGWTHRAMEWRRLLAHIAGKPE